MGGAQGHNVGEAEIGNRLHQVPLSCGLLWHSVCTGMKYTRVNCVATKYMQGGTAPYRVQGGTAQRHLIEYRGVQHKDTL